MSGRFDINTEWSLCITTQSVDRVLPLTGMGLKGVTGPVVAGPAGQNELSATKRLRRNVFGGEEALLDRRAWPEPNSITPALWA